MSGFFGGGVYYNIVTLMLALVALYIAIRTWVEKRPVYFMKTYTIIDEKVEKVKSLKITYETSDNNSGYIKNMSLTKVAFWNNGKKVIRNVDLVPSDLLRIEAAKGEKILWVEVRKEYEKANNIKITIDHSSRFAKIDFKFLGLEDGCVVEVYHTGKGDLKVLGTVIGSNKIRNACYSEDYFLDKLLDPINELIGRIKSPLLERLFGLIVIVGCFPIALICIVLDMMFRISYRVPKKYSFG